MPDRTHPPHPLPEDRRAMLQHLAADHSQDPADLPRDRDALRLYHARPHGGRTTPPPGSSGPGSDDPALSIPAFIGRASAAMDLLLLELAATGPRREDPAPGARSPRSSRRALVVVVAIPPGEDQQGQAHQDPGHVGHKLDYVCGLHAPCRESRAVSHGPGARFLVRRPGDPFGFRVRADHRSGHDHPE